MVSPQGTYHNAVIEKHPADFLLEAVESGIVLIHSEKISEEQFKNFKNLLDDTD